jgi:hypothetical protein
VDALGEPSLKLLCGYGLLRLILHNFTLNVQSSNGPQHGLLLYSGVTPMLKHSVFVGHSVSAIIVYSFAGQNSLVLIKLFWLVKSFEMFVLLFFLTYLIIDPFFSSVICHIVFRKI